MRAPTSAHLKTVSDLYSKNMSSKSVHPHSTRSSTSHQIDIQDTKTVAMATVEGCRDLSWSSCQARPMIHGSMKRPNAMSWIPGDFLWQQKPCGQGVFLCFFFVWLNLLNQSNLIVYATLSGVSTVTPCYTFTAVFVFPAICLHLQSLRDYRYIKLQIVAFKCDHPPHKKNWNQHQKTCSSARISRWIFKYRCLIFICSLYVYGIR